MALARIITRSEACASELSRDLLARGYSVEVLSPDEIPAHAADLELRVETGEGNKLTANVKVRQGERSTSLDFVHQLRTPVAEASDAEPQPVPNRTNRATYLAANAAAESSPLAPLVSLPPQADPATILPIDQQEIAGRGSPDPRGERPGGWWWRAAFGFAAIVLLALVAEFGMSRKPPLSNPGDTGEISGTAPIQVITSSANAAESGTQDSLSKPSLNSDPDRSEAVGQKTGSATGSAALEATGKSERGLVARDTVTYLDERYKPAPKTRPTNPVAGRQTAPRKHDGVIAANSVTDLNDKPTSKPK